MMELIRTWLIGVTCVAMILALADGITPKGSVKRVCKMAGGAVLLLTAIGPVAKLEDADIPRITEKYQTRAEEYRMALSEENNSLYESIIAEETAAYILDKAKELGMQCHVSVTVGWESDGTARPAGVSLFGTWTQTQKEQLCGIVEADLGIPKELQYFKERDDEAEP